MASEPDMLKGQLLIASAGLLDPNFRRTVVLVTEHNPEGAMGVVLNRPSPVPVADAVPHLGTLVEEGGLVFVGGPLQPEAVVALAELDDPELAAATALGSVGYLRADADPDEWTAAYLLSHVTQEQYTAHFNQSPNASFPWFYVGQLMEIQGKLDAAVLAYQKAMSLGSHHTRHWAAYRLQSLSQQTHSPASRPASPAK